MRYNLGYKIFVFVVLVLAPFIGLGIAYAQLQPFTFAEMESMVLKRMSFRMRPAKSRVNCLSCRIRSWQ